MLTWSLLMPGVDRVSVGPGSHYDPAPVGVIE